MKKNIKKVIAALTLLVFLFMFTMVASRLAYAESAPKKGDLKYDGTTTYIGANSEGKDTGLVTKTDQYTSANGGSVEVSAGLFSSDITTTQKLAENDVEVRKTVTKVNDNGEYKVKFDVRGKGTKLQLRAPVYIVVVFDNSNSMAPEQTGKGTCVDWKEGSGSGPNKTNGRCYDKWNNAIAGAKEFAKIINSNIPAANIALVSFAGGTGGGKYNDSKLIRGFETNNFDGLNKSNNFKIQRPADEQTSNSGGTNLEAGLRHAKQLLGDTSVVPSNALKYVVVMGDGEPTYYYESDGSTAGSGSKYDSIGRDHAVNEANSIKKDLNAKIYSIGYEIEEDSDAERVLNDISSNIKDTNGIYTGGYYTAGSVDTIAAKFTDIAEEIIEDAGINAYIIDNIGPAFRGVGEGVSSDGTTYQSQILPSIYETWTTLGEFTIQIDPDSPTGWYKTNKGFTLTYYDVVNEKTQKIVCNNDPEVYWVQNTYDYEVRFYYEDNSGNYIEDTNLRQTHKAANNEVVSELTTEIMDGTHFKDGYKFIEVRDEHNILINELDDKYSIVIDKTDSNIIRVYYQKVYTLKVGKLVDEYDASKPEMTREFQFEISLTDNSNNPISGTYLYKLNDGDELLEITFNSSGTAIFNLKHNEIITFINLPKNVNYEIKELYSDGYVVEITYPNDSKDINITTNKLNLNSNQEITFLNITGYVLPETGSSKSLILMVVTMFLLGTPSIYLVYSFIKKDAKADIF